MKMLREERTYINLSFGLYLELMERQTRLKRQMLHQQICNNLYAYHRIYSLSVSHSNLVYLKVCFESSPETLYFVLWLSRRTVMLLPYRHDLRSPELFSKHHDTFDPLTVLKKQQQHLAKSWTFCCFSNYRDTFASPCVFIKPNLFLMSRKLLLLTIYTKDIVAFGMYQYLGESRSREQINQLLRTIPTVKSDWELSQVNAFLLKEIKHFTKHISEYVGFGCVSSALFTDRSDIKRNDPLTNLDGYGNDVLAMNGLVMFAGKPAICETDEVAQSAYDSIVNVDSDPHSGESCWAFPDSVFNHFGCYMTYNKEQEFP